MRWMKRGSWPRRTLLAGCLVAAVAGSVSFVPALAGASLAQGCQRIVEIDSQRSAGEGAGSLVFLVRTAGCPVAGSVGYSVSSGTAEAGVDFQATSGSLQWAAEDLEPRQITVALVQDSEMEAELETFRVSLRGTSKGVSVVAATGEGRIVDDDLSEARWAVDDPPCVHLMPNEWCTCEPSQMPEPISVNDDEVCVVELSLSAPNPGPAWVEWRTVDGTAVAGVDYVEVPGQLLEVPAGRSVVALPVQLLRPPPGRPAGWFTVRVLAVSPGVLADPVALVQLNLAGS